MTHLHVRLLGGFELLLDDKPNPIKTQKAKGLFAYLVMHRGYLFTRSQLATLLWSGQSSDKAAHSLRQALSTLRKSIPNFETFCHIERSQIMCVGSSELTIDVEQFTIAFEDSEKTAVSLYQGPFLEGFYINGSHEFETWLLGKREQLQTQMLTLLEQLAESAQQQKLWQDAKNYLNKLIEIDPWHEPAHQNLMRLMAKQGEHNRAIALFQNLANKLQEDLSVEPMESSVKLFEKIKAARELQSQYKLPPLNSNFVGRQAEKESIDTLIIQSQARLVTILGPGGVGKSSLALEMAHQLDQQFLNGAFFISLASLSDPQLISSEVATAVNFKAQHNQSFDQQLITFLNNRELLLIFDNFEHLLEGRKRVADILNHTSDITILITSREALNLQQEHRLILEGLPYPIDDKPLQDNDGFASTQLFITQAQKIAPHFQPQEHMTEIYKICQLLQGMPLGIELAAAQLDSQTIAETVTAISENFNSLEKEWGDRPERHHSLQAVFQNAWQRLSPKLKKILGQLAVFQGGFTYKTAQNVAQVSRQDITQLINKSLLHRSGQTTSRYYLHPIVQQFSAEAIATTHLEQATQNHAQTYLQMVQSFQDNDGYSFKNLEQTTQKLGVELDNIRQGWRTAVAHQNLPLLTPSLLGMSKLYASQSWYREGASLFEWTINQLTSTFEQKRIEDELIFWGHLHGFTAGMFLYLSEIKTAQTLAQFSIDTLQPLAAIDELGYAWNMLGISHLYQGDFHGAIDALETSQQTYAKTNNLGQMLGPLINLGSVYQRIGDYEKGLQSLMEAFDISQKINDPRGSTHLLNNIGGILFSLGRFEEAADYFERCNKLCEETGYPMVQAGALLNLAELQIKMETHDAKKIENYLGQGLSLSQQIGDKQKEARAHKLHADHWLQSQIFDQALNALQTGLDIVWEVKAMPTIFEVLLGFANYYLAIEQTDSAKPILAILATQSGVPQHIQTQAVSLIKSHELQLPKPMDLEALVVTIQK